ncbi:enoyl-CoA hydratase/isomerase family protein [Amycolatopsis sp. NPDC004378]
MTVLVELDDGVAVVTLNRPQVLNALNAELLDDLEDALSALRADPGVGAVVLTGAGDRAFAAGADIGQLEKYTVDTALESRMQRLYDGIEDFEKPTIAAVNGFALGGGCELAMACDIRIAARTAKFGLPETALGVLPGAGGTQRLARLAGVGRAVDLVLTGRSVDALEAFEMGLVTGVVLPEELMAFARETAARILARGPLAVRLAKLVIRSGMDADRRTGLVVERLAQAVLYTTDDKHEGAAAFLAKRPARFTGT